MEWQFNVLGHVRSVHFTLVGLSVALMVASTLLPSASVEEAYRQLQSVNRISTNYANWDALEQITRQREIHFFVTTDSYEITPAALVFTDNLIRSFRFENKVDDSSGMAVNPQSFDVLGESQWSSLRGKNNTRERESIFVGDTGSYPPDTLEQFSRVWNFLDGAHAARVESLDKIKTELFLDGESLGDCTVGKAHKGNTTCAVGDPNVLKSVRIRKFVDVELGLMEVSDPKRTPRQWFILIEVKVDEFWFDAIRIPVEISYVDEIDAQQTILSSAESVASGSAEAVFGDLYEVAKGLETLSFSQLSEYIRRLRDERSEQLSVLGIDAPLTLVGKWGVFVLVAFQVYFLLHFQHLRRLELASDVLGRYPWIGLYRGVVPRIVMVLSVGLLPAAAAIVLARPAFLSPSGDPQHWFLAALALASIGLAGLTVLSLVRWSLELDAV